MNKKSNPPKYFFIDESGNFDFSESGSKHFVLTGVMVNDPTVNIRSLYKLKYKLLLEGADLEYFHASEDRQFVRDKVFSYINSKGGDMGVYSIVVNKRLINKSDYADKHDFYQLVCLNLFNKLNVRTNDSLVIVLGSLFTRDKHSLILGTIKGYLKNKKLSNYRIYFHQTKSDIHNQLADYCGWAIFVKFERNENRPFLAISDKIVKLSTKLSKK